MDDNFILYYIYLYYKKVMKYIHFVNNIKKKYEKKLEVK
jgi:hypothetical protein